MYPLDFSQLDDISLTPSPGQASVRFEDIGPLLEYFFTVCQREPSRLLAVEDASCLAVRSLAAAMSRRSDESPTTRPKGLEFACIGAMNADLRVAFCTRVQNASLAAGFRLDSARLITGTLHEMIDNVQEHSERADTGIVGYSWKAGSISYSVGDAGIGVLQSLIKCSDYQNLADHGEALKIAMTEGESRHGRRRGRGQGFKHLLVCLASFNGEGRFRTGDSALLWRRSTAILDEVEIVQRVSYAGFMVHVECRPGSA